METITRLWGGNHTRLRPGHYRAVNDILDAPATPAEKLAAAWDFLQKFPSSRYSGEMIAAVIDLQAVGQDDPAGALEKARATLARIEDAEIRRDVQRQFVGLYGRMGRIDDLQATVAELAAQRPLGFVENLEVVEAAVAGKAWDLAVRHADEALPFATSEAYRNDYPEKKLTDEEAQLAAGRRRCLVLASKGWALVNLGRADEGLATFATAQPLLRRNFVGVPDTPLLRYWGLALMKTGDFEQALEKLAPEAVMGGDEEALHGLKEAYVARSGGEQGFEEYVWRTREELAPRIADFALPDYKGTPLALSSLQGKVILLAFWFPG